MEDIPFKMTSFNDEHFSPTRGGVDPTPPSSSSSRTELYILLAVLSLLCLVGTAGNALVLYVFSKKKDELVSTLFIISLAFVDFITCLLVVPCTMYVEYVDFHISDDFLCKIYHFMITSNIPFSALIMVAIAVDRYLCICHPFVRWFTLARARISIALLGAFVTGLGVCVSLMFGIQYSSSSSSSSSLGVASGERYGSQQEGLGAITATSIRDGASVTEMNLGVKGIEKQLATVDCYDGVTDVARPPPSGSAAVDSVSERLTGGITALTNNTVSCNSSNFGGNCINCIEGVYFNNETTEATTFEHISMAADERGMEETITVWDQITSHVTNNIRTEFLPNFTTQQDDTLTTQTNFNSNFSRTGNADRLELLSTDFDNYSSVVDADRVSTDTLMTNKDPLTATHSEEAQCGLTDAILSNEFALLYQKCYTALFLACLIVVIVLYVLIYQSVLARRTKRQRQKSATLSLVTSQTALVTSRQPKSGVYVKRSIDNADDQDGMIVNEGMMHSYPGGLSSEATAGGGEGGGEGEGGGDGLTVEVDVISGAGISDVSGRAALVATSRASKEPPVAPAPLRAVCRRNSSITRDRIANIKTAAMLFVVTVVFIVTYLPAFLMALEFIPNNVVVFYIYFANNAANPVIYSFMNQNFRNDVARLFGKQSAGAGVKVGTRGR